MSSESTLSGSEVNLLIREASGIGMREPKEIFALRL